MLREREENDEAVLPDVWVVSITPRRQAALSG